MSKGAVWCLDAQIKNIFNLGLFFLELVFKIDLYEVGQAQINPVTQGCRTSSIKATRFHRGAWVMFDNETRGRVPVGSFAVTPRTLSDVRDTSGSLLPQDGDRDGDHLYVQRLWFIVCSLSPPRPLFLPNGSVMAWNTLQTSHSSSLHLLGKVTLAAPLFSIWERGKKTVVALSSTCFSPERFLIAARRYRTCTIRTKPRCFWKNAAAAPLLPPPHHRSPADGAGR